MNALTSKTDYCEEHYRLLAENARDVLWTTDLELNLTYISPSVERIQGYTVEEAYALPLSDRMPPVAYAKAQRLLYRDIAAEKEGQISSDHARTLETEFYHKNGTMLTTETTLSFLRDPNGQATGILGITRDITERKNAEIALRESEERYRKFIEQAKDSVFIADENGTFHDINHQACIELQYDRQTLLTTKKVWDIAPEITPESFRKLWHDLSLEGNAKTIETIHKRKDNTTFPIEICIGLFTIKGKCLMQAIARNITERKNQETERSHRRWWLQQINEFRESTALQLSSYDMPQYIVADLSKRLSRFNEVGVELTCRGQDYHAGSILQRHTPYLELPISLANKENAYLKFFSPCPNDVEAQLEFALEVAEVIAQRLEAQEYEMRITQNSRLNALGEMAAGVAHELNQPLNGVRAFAETLLYDLENNVEIFEEEFRDTLHDIVDQVDRMAEIINYLRTFARNSFAEEPASFQITDTIQKVFKLIGTQLKVNGIDVEFDISNNLPACHGWQHQMEQVFLNLISNARHAIEEHLEERPDTPYSHWIPKIKIEAGHNAPRKEIIISVIDNGCGLTNQVRERIFEPFFTTKPPGKGTGLGLSISRSIIEHHSGTIDITSQPNQGSTVTVRLPIAQKEILQDVTSDITPDGLASPKHFLLASNT